MLLIQGAIILLFVIFFDYARIDQLTPTNIENNGNPAKIDYSYTHYTGIAFMVFVGFGFLTSYMRKFGYSSTAQSYFLAALSLEWAILLNGLYWYIYNDQVIKIWMTIPRLIDGLYASTAVLISFGAVYGRLNFAQLTLMCLFEIIAYGFNYLVARYYLFVVDTGMSMIVHVFGAFFGIAVSWTIDTPVIRTALHAKNYKQEERLERYNSSQFSIIGMVFLWVFWPSFNAAMAPNGTQFQAAINTVLSLCASAGSTWFYSVMFRKIAQEVGSERGKYLNRLDVFRNSSISGTVLFV
jgi:ammonium transporter Rh